MPRAPQDITDATLRLVLAAGIGPTTWRRLRRHFEDDAHIVDASIGELSQIEGIGHKTAAALRRSIDETQPQVEREIMRRHDAGLILADDDDYPALLATIPDPPKALWVRGRLEPDDRLALAMVGSRRCTGYGREQAGRFSALLAEAGLTIVSGGARGIDGEAHRGALRARGRTIAVLGCGLSIAYPPEHEGLFNDIVESGGALLSEYPMTTAPRGEHFPRRNRVISGLTLGTLVIEAASTRSGALITARKAADEHGREVMALPGRVDSPASAGCLHAIREGWASLVRSHADVLEQLDMSSGMIRSTLQADGLPEATKRPSLFDAALSPGQRQILEALQEAGEVLQVEQIAARTEQPMSRIMADLTLLQMHGRIRKDHQGVSLAR